MCAKKALFTVSLGENGGRKYFYSVDKIQEWITYELKYWNWVPNTNFNQKRDLIQKHFKPIQNLNKEINNLDRDRDDFDERLSRVEKQINSLYGNNNIFHSSHPKAKYVNKLKNNNKVRASYTLSYFYDININSNSGDYIIGLLHGFLYDRDINAFDESNREVIQELEISLKEHVEDFKRVINEKKSALESLIEDKRTSLTEKEKEFNNVIENSEKELSRIENVYDQKLALQSSVRYWKTKGKSHENLSEDYQRYFGISLLVTVIILAAEFYFFLGDYGIENAPPYWVTAIVVLTGAGCIWIARILAKIFLSNIHLKADAEERRVKILTFLSLLRREDAISKEDKKAILATLFRPSSTGILKEDKLPSTFWDKLTQQ